MTFGNSIYPLAPHESLNKYTFTLEMTHYKASNPYATKRVADMCRNQLNFLSKKRKEKKEITQNQWSQINKIYFQFY